MAAVGHALEVEVEHGQRLQTLDEAVGIVVEDDALVQKAFWIEDGFQFLHHLIGLVAPLVLHERSHVTASAVLGLQRAVVLLDDEFRHGAHHLCVTGHLVFVGEALVQDEVVVALEGVAVDTGVVVAVVGNEFLQLHRSLRQTLDGEGDVLDETRRAYWSCAAHAGEDA